VARVTRRTKPAPTRSRGGRRIAARGQLLTPRTGPRPSTGIGGSPHGTSAERRLGNSNQPGEVARRTRFGQL
jgi:hypothetical protein